MSIESTREKHTFEFIDIGEEDKLSILPQEVLLLILSHLDAQNVVALNQVSRSFYLLSNDKSLWKVFKDTLQNLFQSKCINRKMNPEMDPREEIKRVLKKPTNSESRKLISKYVESPLWDTDFYTKDELIEAYLFDLHPLFPFHRVFFPPVP